MLKEKIYSKDYATAVSKVLAKADIDQIELGLTYLKRASNNKNDYYERNILSDPFPYLGMQEYGGITGIDNRILLSMYNDKDDIRKA